MKSEVQRDATGTKAKLYLDVCGQPMEYVGSREAVGFVYIHFHLLLAIVAENHVASVLPFVLLMTELNVHRGPLCSLRKLAADDILLC